MQAADSSLSGGQMGGWQLVGTNGEAAGSNYRYLFTPNDTHGEASMSIFSFLKEAGEKILDAITPGDANASDEALKKHINEVGLGNPNIQTTVAGSTVTVTGEVASQEEKEKILLTLGNISGVEKVDDQMTIAAGATATIAATFVTVEKGDTLSKISARVYNGDPNKYQKIFDANKPMLKDVNKIYPGQVLRIPE
jgi:nucleoid-associated protein YgaU